MNLDPAPLSWSEEDEVFMLMLCVRPDRLDDPARWCREMRELSAFGNAIATVEDAERYRVWADRLSKEAGRKI